MSRRPTRDRRAVLRRLRELGATVEAVHRTGELTVRHPALAGLPRVRFDARRQDVPRSVLRALAWIEARHP